MNQGIGEFTPAALDRAGVDRTVVDLTNVFLRVMDDMGEHLERVAAAHDLNALTVLTLRRLDEPMAQRDIAKATHCDPSYVTAMVDRLEAIGAAKRESDPDDRRVKRIVLTEHGRVLREDVGVDLLSGLLFAQALTLEEREQLLDLLIRALGPVAVTDPAV